MYAPTAGLDAQLNRATVGVHSNAAWQAYLNDSDKSMHAVEADLVQRIRAGEQRAFVEFYDRYATLLFTVAARVLADRREAEDVLQDVCTQIWTDSTAYDPQFGTLASWAVTLTRNKALDRVRARTRRARLGAEIAATPAAFEQATAAPSVNELLYGHEQALLIRAAVDELSSEQREAIELAFFKGLSQSEIASTLQQPLGTIKARIRRGMLKLRERLQGVR